MKDSILKALKNKYKNLGFSDKAFDGVASCLEPLVKEETDIETQIAGVEQLLKVFQQETDRVRLERVKEPQRDNSKKGDETSAAGAKTEPAKPASDETPAWAKSLVDAQAQLLERIAKMEGQKVADTRKAQLDGIIAKLPENLRKPYARMAYKDLDDAAFESLKDEVKTEVESLVQEQALKKVVFGKPVANNVTTNKGASDKEVADVVDRLNI